MLTFRHTYTLTTRSPSVVPCQSFTLHTQMDLYPKGRRQGPGRFWTESWRRIDALVHLPNLVQASRAALLKGVTPPNSIRSTSSRANVTMRLGMWCYLLNMRRTVQPCGPRWCWYPTVIAPVVLIPEVHLTSCLPQHPTVRKEGFVQANLYPAVPPSRSPFHFLLPLHLWTIWRGQLPHCLLIQSSRPHIIPRSHSPWASPPPISTLLSSPSLVTLLAQDTSNLSATTPAYPSTWSSLELSQSSSQWVELKLLLHRPHCPSLRQCPMLSSLQWPQK